MKVLTAAKDLDNKIGSVVKATGHIEGMIKDEIQLREIDGIEYYVFALAMEGSRFDGGFRYVLVMIPDKLCFKFPAEGDIVVVTGGLTWKSHWESPPVYTIMANKFDFIGTKTKAEMRRDVL